MRILIPEKVQTFFKHLCIGAGDSELGITRYDEDFIVTDHPVKEHTDNTVMGKDTVMVVILCGHYDFIHDQKTYPICNGSVIRFDGNKLHSLKGCSDEPGRFVALLWDVPVEQDINEIVAQIKNRLNEFNVDRRYDGSKLKYLHLDEVWMWATPESFTMAKSSILRTLGDHED